MPFDITYGGIEEGRLPVAPFQNIHKYKEKTCDIRNIIVKYKDTRVKMPFDPNII